MNNQGWLYCLSNPAMPGLLKIGQTKNEPKIRADQLHTTGVPLPFKIEFAKLVKDYIKKEKILLSLLEQYSNRINPKREFFKISKEEIYAFFELIDGDYLNLDDKDLDVDDNEDYSDDDEEQEQILQETSTKKSIRNMKDYFTDGMKIRHKIGITNIWIGKYDKSSNTIKYKNEQYSTLNKFKWAHYINHNPDLKGKKDSHGSAWKVCEYEKNGDWYSTYELVNKGI